MMATKSLSRKGWASLGEFAKEYRMPDGSWLRITCYEDIDAWAKAWDATAEVGGEVRTSGPASNTPVERPGEAEAMAFVREYGGTFGLILDIRADRRFGMAGFHLSPRQIEVILASKQRDIEWAAKRNAAPVAVPTERITQDGMYKQGDTIYKVQKAIHGSGNLYAKVLIVDGPGDAHFEYAPGAITALRPADKMTLQEAAAFGRLYGVCCKCGAALTDEDSIERGIGPICMKGGFA